MQRHERRKKSVWSACNERVKLRIAAENARKATTVEKEVEVHPLAEDIDTNAKVGVGIGMMPLNDSEAG
jgi:hypothetical protein